MSTDDQNPQQTTMQDLFRVMTALRADHAEFRTEVNSRFDAVETKLDAHTADLSYLKTKVDEHSGELEAVRKVVDELPTMDAVTGLEDGQIGIKRDTEAVRKEVRQIAAEQRKFASRLDRAGIPAE